MAASNRDPKASPAEPSGGVERPKPAVKPAVPLEEMVDRARAARGEAAGDATLSAAAKAPSPTPDAPPGPPGKERHSAADLLANNRPEGADPPGS